MTFSPVIPPSWIAALALIAVVLTVVSHHLAGRRLGLAPNTLLATLRLLALLLVVALLLQPSREDKITPPSVEKSLLFAIDSSASMAESDTKGLRRVDQALSALEEAEAFTAEANPFRFFLFDEDARFLSREGARAATPNGSNTRFHSSVRKIIRSQTGAPPAGLVILSDGHDFEAVPPAQTARLARQRQCPIYAVPFGAAGNARDVSVRATNFHPFTFPKQQTRLTASIRTVGCAHETLTVFLLREGRAVQTKRVEVGDQSFHNVEFVVSEEKKGQYEYAIRAQPLPKELEAENNTAVSYLRVLDEKIRLLVIEGDPYWDTTFLRRSLARNDKLDVDALVRFTETRTRAIRSDPKLKDVPLETPTRPADFASYDMVILGREVDTVLGPNGVAALETYVDKDGGIVLFSRGRAWTGEGPDALEPVRWSDDEQAAELEVTSGALSIAPFRMLHQRTTREELPTIVAYRPAGELKTLAAPYGQTAQSEVAIVYRRLGRGQTLSLGLGDLWKWVFNDQAEFDNNLYDLFWDQLALWLLAKGGVTPSSDYSFQTSTANLPLGESLRISLSLADKEPPASPPEVLLHHGKDEAARIALSPDPDGDSYSAEFTPRTTGRYRAEITLPDGVMADARFMVYREEMERTETAADVAYLKQLSQSSGGRLLQPREIPELITTLLRDSAPMEERTRLTPIWDTTQICLLIAFLFGLEWYLRRRWGLN